MRSNQTSREFIRYLKELDEAAEVACVGKEFQKLIDTCKGQCLKTDFFGRDSRIKLALRRDAALSGFSDNQCLRPIEMSSGLRGGQTCMQKPRALSSVLRTGTGDLHEQEANREASLDCNRL